MSTIYLQKSRQSRRRFFSRSTLVVVIIIALALSLLIFAGRTVSKTAMVTGGPVASVFATVKREISFVHAFASSRSTLINENRKLELALQTEQDKILRFNALFAEHQTLLDAYNRSSATSSVVLANIIAKPPQSPYDILLADVGSGSGVVLGSRVYGLGGIPLGRVGEVTSSQAKIVLFSSVGEESEAIIERTGATVTLTGVGGGNMESEVSQEVDIVLDDIVVLPQFNGALVATVVDVEETPTSAFKKVLYRTPINIFNIRFVEIVKVTQ